MRRLFWQISTSLDGFMEGPNRELDYTAQVVDKDFERYASDMLKSIDTIVLGRVTYELFAKYWPTATGPDADRMNELPKLIFSKKLNDVSWKNSRLAREDVGQEIAELKRQPGKDIALFGSAGLASTFMRRGLIDEYRILVTPFVLGVGKPAFKGIKDRLDLKLLKTTEWSSGIVVHYYQPA
jgi:dihydrofolate reductase